MHADVRRETPMTDVTSTSTDGNEDESSGINISRVSYRISYRIISQTHLRCLCDTKAVNTFTAKL